eukprot:g1922.t1
MPSRGDLTEQQVDLLRSCEKLGTYTDWSKKGVFDKKSGTFECFEIGERCLDGLKDIQRFLRRDDPYQRVLYRSLGEWGTVRNKILACLIDPEANSLVQFEIIRLLTVLTMPLDPDAEIDESFRDQDLLQKYVEAIVEVGGVMAIVRTLEGAFSSIESTGKCSERDEIMLELVLTLFKNLLTVNNDERISSASGGSQHTHVREDLLKCFHEDSVLDTIVAIVELIGGGIFEEFNVLVLELIHLIFRGYDPKGIIKGGVADTTAATRGGEFASSGAKSENRDPFAALMAEDKSRRKLMLSATKSRRHSRFGGCIQVKMLGGMSSVATAPLPVLLRDPTYVLNKQQPSKRRPTAVMRRQREESELSARMLGTSGDGTMLPISETTAGILRDFCEAIVDGGGYVALMRSIERFMTKRTDNWFTTDNLNFLHVLWFCTRFRRLRAEHVGRLKDDSAAARKASVLKETVTPAIFSFVVHCCKKYDPVAKEYNSSWGSLGLCVALLAELLATLYRMVTSSDDETRNAGEKLQKHVFYEADLIYMMQSFLSNWDERRIGKPHLIHLVYATHILFKCAERFAAKGKDAIVQGRCMKRRKNKKTVKKNKGTDDVGSEAEADAKVDEVDGEGEKKGSVAENDAIATASILDETSKNPESVSEEKNSTTVTAATTEKPSDEVRDNDDDAKDPDAGKETKVLGDDGNNDDGSDDVSKNSETGKETKALGDNDDDVAKNPETEEKKEVAEYEYVRHEKYFDLEKFQHEFMTNKILRNYCALFADYRTNGPKTNHYILCYLDRLRSLTIKDGEDGTMESMLWQLSIMVLFDRFLSDPTTARPKSSRRRDVFGPLRTFVKSIVRTFLEAAGKNPLLWVESLFWRNKKENGLLQSHYDVDRVVDFVDGKLDDAFDELYDDVENEEEWIEKAMKRSKQSRLEASLKATDEPVDMEKTRRAGDHPLSADDASEDEMKLSDDDEDGDVNKVDQIDLSVVPESNPWTPEEDAILREQWDDVKDMESRYQILALEDALSSKQRTVEQVTARVVELGLVAKKRNANVSSDLRLRRAAVRDSVRVLRTEMCTKGDEESTQRFKTMIEWIAEYSEAYLRKWRSHLRRGAGGARISSRGRSYTAFEFFCEDNRDSVIAANPKEFAVLVGGENARVEGYGYRNDSELPDGWEIVERQRGVNGGAGGSYKYYVAPDKSKHRSVKEINRHLGLKQPGDERKNEEKKLVELLEAKWKDMEESEKATYRERASAAAADAQKAADVQNEATEKEGESTTKPSSEIDTDTKEPEKGEGEEEEEKVRQFHPEYPDLPSLARIERALRVIVPDLDFSTTGVKAVRKMLEKQFEVKLKPLKNDIHTLLAKIINEKEENEEEDQEAASGDDDSEYSDGESESRKSSANRVRRIRRPRAPQKPFETTMSLEGKSDAQKTWLSHRRTQQLLRAMRFTRRNSEETSGGDDDDATSTISWTLSTEDVDVATFGEILRALKSAARIRKKPRQKRIGDVGDMYECEFDCGFEDTSMDKVEAHEKCCSKRPDAEARTDAVNALKVGSSIALLYDHKRWDAKVARVTSTHVEVLYSDRSSEKILKRNLVWRLVLDDEARGVNRSPPKRSAPSDSDVNPAKHKRRMRFRGRRLKSNADDSDDEDLHYVGGDADAVASAAMAPAGPSDREEEEKSGTTTERPKKRLRRVVVDSSDDESD